MLSSQNADTSSETSGGIITSVLSAVYPEFDEMNEVQREEIVGSLQFIVRKTAHFSLYGVLGFFAFLTFISYRRLRLTTRNFLSLLICFLYAVSDEIHQLFVVGRSCELRDVAIDFSGSLLAVLTVTLFCTIVRPIYRHISFRSPNTTVREGNDVSMRKKALLEQNTQLFDRLTTAEMLISDLKKQIEEQSRIIENQKNDIERLNSRLTATEPLKNLESKVIKQASITPEVDYGAAVIGKTVVEAAKFCNKLTAQVGAEDAKERVNLILGKTEVTKAEILKVVSETADFEDKKQKIDVLFDLAIDYFKSIMAQ